MNLDFVGIERIEVVSGGADELLDRAEHAWHPSRGSLTVLHEPSFGSETYYVFSEPEIEELIEQVQRRRHKSRLRWPLGRRSDMSSQLRDMLRTEHAAPVVREDVLPDQPSIVVDHGDVAGVWVSHELGAEAGVPLSVEAMEAVRDVEAPREARQASLEDMLEAGAPQRGTAKAPAANGEPAADPVIRRTPHLDAPRTIEKQPGFEFTVDVRTDAAPFAEGEEGEGIEIEAPADVTEVKVRVWLTASDHFEIVGKEVRQLTIVRDESDSQPARFRLKVAARPPRDTRAGISALFVAGGRQCGYVARTWEWTREEPLARPAEPDPFEVPTVPLRLSDEAPDLSVYITSAVSESIRYECAVETPLLAEYSKPDDLQTAKFPVQADLQELVSRQLYEFTNPDKDPATRQLELLSAGTKLFNASPQVFQDVLWKLVDAGKKPKTIYVASAEPFLPWELMVPHRDSGTLRELRPLGVEFALGRWTRRMQDTPQRRIRVRNSLVIAPEYEDESRRLDSAAELQVLAKRLGGKRVTPATREALNEFFSANSASVLHFVCHGETEVEDDDVIVLDRDEQLKSAYLAHLAGFKKLCRESQPLVFLNSCDVGRQVHSIAGGAGFPRAFGEIGARAIIAPLWPVHKQLASEIAVEIYEKALAPDSPLLAEIVRDIRARAYEEGGEDTYAAYCFYGDPLTRLEVAAQ